MKILQINPIVGHSSTGRAVSELDRYFFSKGHICYVACIDGYGSSNIYKIGSRFDHKLHAFLSRLTGFEASFSRFATWKLINYMKMLHPDVVKIGIIHSNYLNYKMLFNFLGKNDVPTVIVLDDCWHFTGKCMHYTNNGCYKWKIGCGNCPHLENGLPTWFFDQTSRLLTMKQNAVKSVRRLGVVGVSDWITNEAKQSVLQTAKIIKRIYNWIDLTDFHPIADRNIMKSKYSLSDKYVVLGVASSWKEGKGIDDFIRLAGILDEQAAIVLVGRIPSEISLPNNVVHIQETHDVKELAAIYSMADVFLTFSKEESFGKVSAEALACGTPVICYDATACPELVGPNCGEVVPVGDFAGVVRAIETVRRRDKEAYSPYCVSFAGQNFSLEKSADEYLRLFEQLRMM